MIIFSGDMHCDESHGDDSHSTILTSFSAAMTAFSMDWSTSKQFLAFLSIDCMNEDNSANPCK